MKCIFVVDVQNGFVSSKTQHVIPKIKELLPSFSDGLIIATKFINRPGSPYDCIINWGRLKTSPETDLYEGIEPLCNHIIEKDIYSALTNEVIELLKENNVTEAYIAGIDTDCCVLKTAVDLFERNIKPFVLVDYCASNGGEESHLAAIRVLQRSIGYNQLLYGSFRPEN